MSDRCRDGDLHVMPITAGGSDEIIDGAPAIVARAAAGFLG